MIKQDMNLCRRAEGRGAGPAATPPQLAHPQVPARGDRGQGAHDPAGVGGNGSGRPRRLIVRR